VPTDPVLLDGPALAHALGVTPALVRKWAQRGKLTRRGTDQRGRALYDYSEALRVHAEQRRKAARATEVGTGETGIAPLRNPL